ncbi:MAG TPA: GNAT family N-acetyltransferase [Methanospirillum sp.]|nr:GNAT family N-acetyltransferase [Methanospirillum sp.]
MEQVSELVARSFCTPSDEVASWIYAGHPRAVELAVRLFRFFVWSLPPGAQVYQNEGGVAVWFPPGIHERGLLDTLASGLLEMLIRSGFRHARRLWYVLCSIDNIVESRHQPDWWYLHLMAVDPDHRGEGYADQLIRPVIEEVDLAGGTIALITQKKSNVRFYERYGFQVAEETPLQATPIRFWFMVRNSHHT